MTTILAIMFPDITKVLAIMGGLCSVAICYIIPSNFECVLILFHSILLFKTQS